MDCPACLFQGNAVVDSSQRGIIIHGSHRTRVRSNVLHNVKGANLYVEDGNEMHNAIVANVAICPQFGWCRIAGTDNPNADDVHQSGTWALSATNDFINNRHCGHVEGFFVQTQAHTKGRGGASWKVCTNNAPFGIFRGNVNHSNERFGTYLDHQWCRNIKRSIASNGYVEDMEACNRGEPCSCDSHTSDGKDNGAFGIVEGHLDYFNTFVGQYELGDVQFKNHHSINNMHGLYWKHTKNFAHSPTEPHILDSKFEWITNNELSTVGGPVGSGTIGIAGPGGVGAFKIKNTEFRGYMVGVAAGQHCATGGNSGTGGLCTPEYSLENVSFFGMDNFSKIMYGFSGGYPDTPMWHSPDNSLEGARSMANAAQGHLLRLPECSSSGKRDFSDSISCSLRLNRLQIWSTGNWGAIKLSGPNGGEHWMQYIFGHGWKQGYGAALADGYEYTLELSRPGEAVLEIGDPMFGDFQVTLNLVNSSNGKRATCQAKATHDRSNLSPFGPLRNRGGPLGACWAQLQSIL